ncbi:phosphoribosylanthranilate isomerase [Commensalibacter papalotli (ex Servin-Garciduenas et al. 2014)]|uniref:N-(5'-phosphoribosyl)anthranilate isomerase n=1 Tax=Commensalibacter papalotli (ex Servin-Garciduenas et al. 2014) TaxID=1208583 RepID=W7E3X1_9PROT|nr:phosphoribosylanthranilate isomerase [Commensalibacter papalotli (ex Servin-Garciduenas et al. 2014)]EUK17746.1 N-(5'-phosphoribosyl)anthranilate isomerase [Commensalibacter papalotli (ex Servin-Garciduenas et al. 2014)]
MSAIKVCGIKTAETYDLLLELNVNWAGLVFYPPSPRYITLDQARQLPDYKNHGLLKVGLFVKPTLDDIAKVLDHVHLDILQLYTSTQMIKTIRNHFGLPVWLAQGIRTVCDLPDNYDVDGLVIEAPSHQSDLHPGGNGRTFDWQLTSGWQAPRPWLLAGGLTPTNVTQAIKQSGARAVDVSSGVERQKGEKDHALIREFVGNINNFDF